MAVKIFCDCCGREGASTKFSFLTHLNPKRGEFVNGYVDQEGNRVSGRTDTFDLCHKCYNTIVGAAINKFVELRQTYDMGEPDEMS